MNYQYVTQARREHHDNDSFVGAFGNKPGADRRKQRRQHKGHKYD